ncbi:MAG: hypothetical protein JNK04_13120, partial [Myxococcales bacterium]|nr:hypothetical protein [Myxococcales bacterium]
MRRIGIPALLLLACGDTSAPTGGTSNPGGAHAGGGVEGGSGGEVALGPSSSGGEGEGGSGGEGGRIGGEYAVSTALISSQHRFIDGAMFGGWGPHLGHLITLGDDVFLVDDICAQPGDASLGACDVNDDHTLGYYRRATDGWSLVTTTTLPGVVQQNTATIASADGSVLHTFGIDVAGEKLQECVFAVPAGPVSCSELPFTLAPSSNYIGAAISPLGHRVVWWTTVVDGGGGGFHYIVDYGGGWNGPRSGDVIGFNDASY